jgi:putative PIN family toxin of toxin-antitoxin system
VKLVVDTNVVISGLLWLGNPGRLLEAAASGLLRIYTSSALVDELAISLGKGKLAPRVRTGGLTLDELLRRYLDVAIVVEAPPIAPVVLADPDDDHVLACALAAQADLIVSGDSDLLDLKSFQGIPIVAAAEALERIAPR